MIKQILSGINGYFLSFKIIKKLKLWKYFFVPVLISFFLGILIFSLSYSFSDEIGAQITKIWIWDWGKESFTVFCNFIGGFMVLLLGIVLYKHLVLALISPFMSPVSEKIEIYYLNSINKERVYQKNNKSSFISLLNRGIRLSIRNLGKELFYTFLLLILSLIPVVNLVTAPLILLVQSYYAGFGSLDYTLERYFNYRESVNFVKNNRGLAIGNGIIFTLLLLVPVVGFVIVLPLSVTASSIKALENIHNYESQNRRS